MPEEEPDNVYVDRLENPAGLTACGLVVDDTTARAELLADDGPGNLSIQVVSLQPTPADDVNDAVLELTRTVDLLER